MQTVESLYETLQINSSPPSATYMSVNQVSIGLDDGFSPNKRQDII